MKVAGPRLGLLVGAGFAALLYGPFPTLAATAPDLGQAKTFGILGGSTVTNTGPSVITGDLGVSPGTAITGFPPGTVIGTIHAADAVAAQAQSDVTAAFNDLASQACDTIVTADLGGTTLLPGVYCSGAAMALTSTLTLDAQGDPTAVFVFQMGTTLTTASNSLVRLINGGQSCNVFWQIGTSATLGAGTAFAGNMLALASITLTTGASANGRALAKAAVTMDSNAVSVCSLVPTAPTLGKAFGPATIDAGGVSTLTITVSNPDATVATLTAPLVDTLPSGLVIAATPNVATTCGGIGAPVAIAGSSTVTLPAGRSIPANGSCTLTVNVTAAAGGSYINTLAADALVTSNGNNAAPAVATLTVVPLVLPPTLGKAFSPATIDAGAVSTLTITVSNPNVAVATLTAPLVDTLPSGVVIAATPNVGTTCGGVGAPVAIAGSSTVTLPAGRSIPANGSCTLTVDVTAAVGGSYINTLAAGALVTSSGNNAGPAVASLTVVALVLPPTLGKAFSPATIDAGAVSTLIITVSNPDVAVATLTAALIDTLPSGVVIAATPNVSTTCGGVGAPVAIAGESTVTLPAGRTIPANASCTLTVDMTGAVAGSHIDTLAAGALVTSNGNNAGPAVATLTVVALVLPPTLGKAFSPATINVGAVATLTITVSNPDAAVAALTAPLVDTLPSGVVIAATPNVSTTCGGVGAPVAVAGSSTVTLPAGRSIPANGSCTLTVDVTAATGSAYINTLAAGALVTSNGNNAGPAIVTLTVVSLVAPPTLGKAFSPATINAGAVSTLTVTVSNPDAAVATLTAPLVDTLPSGTVIAATPNVSTTCGGVGAPVAVAGGSTVTLPAGRSIPANGSCTLTVDVTAALGGAYINTLLANALMTTNGNNAAPAVATLTVVSPVAPPTLGKAFSPATVNAGAGSMLTITFSNPEATVATLTAPLVDTLPSGAVIAGTPNVSTTCGGVGAPVAGAGGSTVTLPAGRSIPANGSCTLTVDVAAAVGGSYIDTLLANALMTTNGNNAAPAVATLTVVPLIPPVIPIPPTLGKAFSPATINAGGLSTLTITSRNPDATVATLTSPLVDTLPSGVVIAATPNASTTCGGVGAPVAVASGSTVTLPAGRSIPANGSCTLTVDVTAATGGSYINTLLANTLVTTNGNNAAPVFATLTVVPPVIPIPPTLDKAFSPATINAGGVSTLTITVSNPDPAVSTLTAPLIDTLPSGVVIAATPNVSTTCGGVGAPVVIAGGSTVTLPAGRSIPATGSCTLTVNVTAAAGGAYINILLANALVTDKGNSAAPAVATLTVVPLVPPSPTAPTLGKAFSPATINAGGVSTLTTTVSNPDAAVATLTAPLVDTLPSGVVIAPTPNVGTTCSGVGAPVAVAGGSTVTLPAGRSIPATGSCTLTVDVTAAVGGTYINTLLAHTLVTTNGNNAAPAVATLTVVPLVPPVIPIPPTLGKAFSPATINAGGVSTLTITVSNPDAAVATLTAPLVDTLPSGVVIAPTPNVGTTCSGVGAPVAVAGGSTVTLPAGRSIPATGSCTLTVNVTAAVGGTYINTLLANTLVTTNGNNAAPVVATLTVVPLVPPVIPIPPTLGKAFSPATINAGGVSTLTITVSNPNLAIAILTAPLIDTLPNGVVIAATPNVSTTCGGVGAPMAVAGGSTATLPAGRSIPATGSCTLAVDVTAAVGGTFINTLLAGALMTTNGNNAAPVVATLTVVPLVPPVIPIPPALGKAFGPATINAGGVSTLTITVSNPNLAIAILTAPLIDTLPSGVVIAVTPNVSTTCSGVAAPIAVAGGSTVTLPAGRSIPATGSCTLTVNVTAAVGGTYINTLLANTLVTTNGNNAAPAIVTLTVVPSIAAPIPALSAWAMIMLAAVLVLFGVAEIRRHAGSRRSMS